MAALAPPQSPLLLCSRQSVILLLSLKQGVRFLLRDQWKLIQVTPSSFTTPDGFKTNETKYHVPQTATHLLNKCVTRVVLGKSHLSRDPEPRQDQSKSPRTSVASRGGGEAARGKAD